MKNIMSRMLKSIVRFTGFDDDDPELNVIAPPVEEGILPKCEHDFEHVGTIFIGYNCPTIFTFACKKCDMIYKLSSVEITDSIFKLNREYVSARQTNSVERIPTSKITLFDSRSLEYNNVGVTLTIKKFKDNGVDLMQIDHHNLISKGSDKNE